MEPTEIRNTLRGYLQQFIRAKELGDGDNIFTSGFVNSLFAMQLILYVEQTFNIVVEGPDLTLGNFCSVDALCAFVLAKQPAQAQVR